MDFIKQTFNTFVESENLKILKHRIKTSELNTDSLLRWLDSDRIASINMIPLEWMRSRDHITVTMIKKDDGKISISIE